MNRKLVLVMGILLLAVSPVAQGATRDFSQFNSKYTEMQENLAWLTEGLSKLGDHKNAKLVLTKAQKKKILTIFQSLIDKKLIRLEIQDNGPGDQGNAQRQGQGAGQQQGGRQRMFNPEDPQMQERMKQMQSQTDFGNKQIDLIEEILTGEQVKFIDNLDFKGEKYGFLDPQRMFVNNRQGGTSGGAVQGGGQGFNQRAFQEMRQKIRAGQELLVKLNKEVLKMLKS